MTAVLYVQVLPADWAQPLAIRFADRVDRNFEKSIIPNYRLKIDLGIFGNDQPRLANGLFAERIQLGHLPGKWMAEGNKAAGALQRSLSGKVSGDQQSLRGTIDADQAVQASKFKVFADLYFLEFKREIVNRTDFLMNDEADI